MGNQEGMGVVQYPQMKFQGFFHLGYVCIFRLLIMCISRAASSQLAIFI